MAINYKKTHPYFKLIGNDPKYGCAKICDNLWQNELTHQIFINYLKQNKRKIDYFLNKSKKAFQNDKEMDDCSYDWESFLNKKN